MKTVKQYAPSALFLVFVFVLSVLFFAYPKSAYSENEKRYLAEMPEASVESLLDGTLREGFEEYVSDHFPARDVFVGLYSYYELLTGRGGTADIYHGKDGYLIGAESALANEENAVKNMKNYAAFADALSLDATVMIVPSTGCILDSKLPLLHADYHDEAYLTAAEANCGNMTWLDMTSRFNAVKDSTQLYYKTDHHLTADGSYELYKAFLESQGIVPRTDFEKTVYDGFYGTCYSRGGYWLSEADRIELWRVPNLQVNVTVSDGVGEPITSDSLFFEQHLEEADKYPVYLDGNHGYTKIENPDADGGKLLIVKDSFAHCVTTMLAAHYSEIHMIDLRYYNGGATQTVADIVKSNGIDNALFLYGVDSLSTEAGSSYALFHGIETALPVM